MREDQFNKTVRALLVVENPEWQIGRCFDNQCSDYYLLIENDNFGTTRTERCFEKGMRKARYEGYFESDCSIKTFAYSKFLYMDQDFDIRRFEDDETVEKVEYRKRFVKYDMTKKRKEDK